MFRIGEVLEIKKAFKANQKDDEGNDLALGSILCRMWGQNSILGNIHHIWARPSQFSRRMPLIGEHVILYHGPVHTDTDGIVKTNGYYYLNPINATDDLVFHQHPKIWLRQKDNKGSVDKSRPKPGPTFPMQPKRVDNVQIFDSDDIIESRYGSSIRLGHSLPGGPFDKQPTWQGPNNAPITILRVKNPQGGPTNPGAARYTIEDVGSDDSSIYMTTKQLLPKVKVAFKKNIDSNTIPTFNKPQVLVDADRVVIHGKKEKVIINAKDKSIVCGKKVILQSNKYYCDIDELLDWLKDFIKQYMDLSTAKAQLATPAGPTAVATNAAQVVKLAVADFNAKFKVPK